MHGKATGNRHKAPWGYMPAALALLGVAGCASPGPPRPPSLHLPAEVRGLSAERVGDTVTLRFTMPQRTTDDLPIREAALTPILCRADHGGTCMALPQGKPLAVHGQHGTANAVSLDDTLPTQVASGPLRLLEYRVELLNGSSRTAGFSKPVWATAGTAPAAVGGLNVEPTRLGSLISWQRVAPQAGETVVVARTRTAPPAKGATGPANVLLRADDTVPSTDSAHMLDTSAIAGEPYTYRAYREREITLNSHALTLRSADSAPISFTLRDVFPPPVPTGLSAAGFTTEATEKQPATFAVDLIWQPVEDPGLAGYNVYRQELDAAGTTLGPRELLTKTPLTLPAFHDTTASPQKNYRWNVTSIDLKGNESSAATTERSAQTAP